MLVLLRARYDVSLCSFANVAGAPSGIASASIGLVFLTGIAIFKMYLKTMGRKTIVFLASNNVNSIKNMKALNNAKISYEKLILVSNETENYYRLKDGMRTKDIQRGNIEKDRLIQHDKRIEVDEVLRQNKRQSQKAKQKHTICGDYKSMLSYCLKCRKETEIKTEKSRRLKNPN